MPAFISNFKKIEKIFFAKNKISELPEGFEKLTSLKEINLSSNLFKSIPIILGQIVSLTSLVMNESNLTEIPQELKTLTNLETLSLEKNQISSFGEGILENFTNLLNLHFDQNNFEVLSEDISKCKKLLKLSFSGNKIKILPKWLNNLKLADRCLVFCNFYFIS